MAATFTSYPVLQEFVPSTSTPTSVRYEPPTTKLAIQRDKRYHVFLSFRGPDVRMTLLDHLFEALSTARLKVFLDTEHLVKGEKFELAIERAMKSSAICIPIFSKGYADSAWCLSEAAAMLKTPALIIPLYYDVVQTHVRNPLHVSSPYKNSFERHYKDRYPTAEVDNWKNALKEISSRLGWSKDFTRGSDARLIKTVVHDVIKALDQRTNPGTMQFPIQRSVSPQQCPENWSQGKVLGKGSFGIVYEGLNRDDGSLFAVKISDVESLESAAFEVRQEIDILQKLNHPNIVRYLGSSVHEGRLCIFLELVAMGSLRHVLDIYNQFEENTIRMYSRQILRGLEYLHDQNIIHRDLKCANILLHSNGQVKLADFGLAKEMNQSLANSCKGTPLYMAPEMITLSKEERKYGKEVDIWSLGCTLIEMAGGKPPWSDLEGFSFLFKLKRGELPPIPDHLSEEAKNFLGMCLRVKPEERAIVSELLQHPFVTNAPAVAPLFTHHSELLQHLSVTNAPAVA